MLMESLGQFLLGNVRSVGQMRKSSRDRKRAEKILTSVGRHTVKTAWNPCSNKHMGHYSGRKDMQSVSSAGDKGG
jgi:general stress protein YciG